MVQLKILFEIFTSLEDLLAITLYMLVQKIQLPLKTLI
nr:MAG TPA: hypothetical protein [Caudoviricetes sp.]